jgi:hypothetical protein
VGTNAKTDYSAFTFTVKEFGDGTPWIMCEEYQPGLPVLKDGYLGLRLREGTTIEQAQEIAEYLRDHVAGVSHTRFLS